MKTIIVMMTMMTIITTMTTSLLTLFFSSFLAATFIPFSSELHLATLVSEENLAIVLVTATLGNTLGGLTNYFIGYFVKLDFASRFLRIKEKEIDRAKILVSKYGMIMSFFCFLPIVGDPLAFVLGLRRYSVFRTVILMSLGKFLRYLFVSMSALYWI